MKVIDPSIRMMVGNMCHRNICRGRLCDCTPISKAEKMRVKILARGKDSSLKITDKQATLQAPMSARLADEPPAHLVKTPKAPEMEHISTAKFIGASQLKDNSPMVVRRPEPERQTLTLDTQDGGETNPEVIRLELTSHFDYFMQYVYEVHTQNFNGLREAMNLTCNFQGFLTMLIKLCDMTIMHPEENKLVMVMNTDSTATLAFIKKLAFKDMEQLSMTLRMGDMNVITKHVQYDYNMIRY